ncbi:MAG: hypothetical protein QM569_02180 [Acidovorax sp.]
MIIALVALVILTLLSIGLMRTVGSSASIAGNLAFEQAAATSADQAVETAIAWLENNTASLTADVQASGYAASRLDPDASSTDYPTWAELWTYLAKTYTPGSVATDSAGNSAQYLIQRMCSSAGAASSANGCSSPPISSDESTHSTNSSAFTMTKSTEIYYRITVKVSGPRNTVSYIQTMVAL